MRLTLATLLLLAAAACGPSVPAEPTWLDDVRPILAANCIRCHSPPYIGGVPEYFRLDIYENDLVIDPGFGDPVYGAERMSRGADEGDPVPLEGNLEVVAIDGTMPPRVPLTDRQVDVLVAWHAAAEPKGEPRDDNSAPTMTLTRDPNVFPDKVGLYYEIEDADDDIVTGIVLADPDGGQEPIVETNEIFVGRGSVAISLESGTFDLTAELDDGHERVTVELGRVVVP